MIGNNRKEEKTPPYRTKWKLSYNNYTIVIIQNNVRYAYQSLSKVGDTSTTLSVTIQFRVKKTGLTDGNAWHVDGGVFRHKSECWCPYLCKTLAITYKIDKSTVLIWKIN